MSTRPFVIDESLATLLSSEADLISEQTGNARLGQMFLVQMRDTLEKTINIAEDGTTFVITGDIPAMWLRDSTTQMLPFMRFLGQQEGLQEMICGLLERQFRYILHDPYANAFNEEANGNAWHADDLDPDPWLWERKFELDSLAFPVQLAHQYYEATGRLDFLTPEAIAAFRLIVDTLELEQRHAENSRYRFVRDVDIATETLERNGLGSPVGYTGMAWAGFRPSDDACTYHYNIPGNLLAAMALDYIAEFAGLAAGGVGGDATVMAAPAGKSEGVAKAGVGHRDATSETAGGVGAPASVSVGALGENLARDARRLAAEIRSGVEQFGTVEHPEFGRIFAYEVDGLGNVLLMDDSNMPSLLSLPLTSTLSAEDETYRNTRAFVFSDVNPYFVRGTVAVGLGSPHTPPGYIWHIALAVQALTLPHGATDGTDPSAEQPPGSNSVVAATQHAEQVSGSNSTGSDADRRVEQLRIAELMASTDAGTGLMHEGFDANDPTKFTREWFSWANSMFCELLLDIVHGPKK